LEACDEIGEPRRRTRLVETQLETLGGQMDTAAWLRTISGVAPLTSTALVAVVGDVTRFPCS
jgi:hypothetical protein